MTQTSLLKQLLGALVGVGIALVVYGVIDTFSKTQASLIRPTSPIADANVNRMRFASKDVDDKSFRQVAYRAQSLAKALEAQEISSSASSDSSTQNSPMVAALIDARRDMRLEHQEQNVEKPIAVHDVVIPPETIQRKPALSQSGIGLWSIGILAGGIAGISLSRRKATTVH